MITSTNRRITKNPRIIPTCTNTLPIEHVTKKPVQEELRMDCFYRMRTPGGRIVLEPEELMALLTHPDRPSSIFYDNDGSIVLQRCIQQTPICKGDKIVVYTQPYHLRLSNVVISNLQEYFEFDLHQYLQVHAQASTILQV